MKLGTLLDQLDVREALDNIEIDDIYYIDDEEDLQFTTEVAKDTKERFESIFKGFNDYLIEEGFTLDIITSKDVLVQLIIALTVGEA